jgi:hypothetical protein
MVSIGSPETPISNHHTQRNNPQDGRIRFKKGGSLRYRNPDLLLLVEKELIL